MKKPFFPHALLLFALPVLAAGCARSRMENEIITAFRNHSAEYVPDEAVRNALEKNGFRPDSLKSLDRYAVFVPQGQARLNEARISGIKVGTGLRLVSRDGYIVVSDLAEDSGAGESAVMAGDRILSIDRKSMAGANIAEATELLQGRAGTVARLEIERGTGGSEERLNISMVRNFYKIPSVTGLLRNDKTGYVRIASFGAGSSAELRKVLEKMSGEGVKRLVIDLRYNPGGMLEQVVGSLKLFVGGGSELFETRSRHAGYRTTYSSDKTAPFENLPLAVLVNGGTMSGAEIFAGALKDNRKALVVGEKTKGVTAVQKLFRLAGNMGLKLTVCVMVPPSGRAIEGAGLEPDVEVKMGDGQLSRLQEALVNNDADLLTWDPFYSSAVKILRKA